VRHTTGDTGVWGIQPREIKKKRCLLSQLSIIIFIFEVEKYAELMYYGNKKLK
jgi:hypothetical protein